MTKSHPVRIDGVWRKPQDIGIPAANPSDHVWNFVLEANHILLVNAMECCTLGHGFQEEGVFHEYWGSRVLDDLAKLPGWAQGRVMAFSQKGPDGHISMVVSKKYKPSLLRSSPRLAESVQRSVTQWIVTSRTKCWPADKSPTRRARASTGQTDCRPGGRENSHAGCFESIARRWGRT